jgi:hypothetical protein
MQRDVNLNVYMCTMTSQVEMVRVKQTLSTQNQTVYLIAVTRWCIKLLVCVVNLVKPTHRHVPFRCMHHFADSCKSSMSTAFRFLQGDTNKHGNISFLYTAYIGYRFSEYIFNTDNSVTFRSLTEQ